MGEIILTPTYGEQLTVVDRQCRQLDHKRREAECECFSPVFPQSYCLAMFVSPLPLIQTEVILDINKQTNLICSPEIFQNKFGSESKKFYSLLDKKKTLVFIKPQPITCQIKKIGMTTRNCQNCDLLLN